MRRPEPIAANPAADCGAYVARAGPLSAFSLAGRGDVVELLTVFRKTKMREDAEVQRARLAQKTCAAEHSSAHGEFVRIIEEGEV
jgi:hypothetical protein